MSSLSLPVCWEFNFSYCQKTLRYFTTLLCDRTFEVRSKTLGRHVCSLYPHNIRTVYLNLWRHSERRSYRLFRSQLIHCFWHKHKEHPTKLIKSNIKTFLRTLIKAPPTQVNSSAIIVNYHAGVKPFHETIVIICIHISWFQLIELSKQRPIFRNNWALFSILHFCRRCRTLCLFTPDRASPCKSVVQEKHLC